jgi:hypothetical protein
MGNWCVEIRYRNLVKSNIKNGDKKTLLDQ